MTRRSAGEALIRPRRSRRTALAASARRRPLVAARAPAAAEDERQRCGCSARGAGRDPARPLGRAPRSRPARGTTSGSARASATGRIASGSSTSTGGSAPGGCRRSPARAGLEADRLDAHARAAPRRRARGRGARAGAALRARGVLRRRQRGRRATARCRSSSSSCGSVRAVAPADVLTLTKLLVVRAVDQLGARAAARRDGARAGRRAGGAPRPRLPAGQPGGRDPGRRLGGRRARRSRSRSRSCEARSGSRPRRPARTTGRSPDRARRPGRRCWPAIRTCRRACRGSPTRSGSTWATGSAGAPRSPGLPGVMMGQNNDVAWSFTNAMADVMDLFVERIEGDALRVRGRAPAAGGDRGGDRRQGRGRARAARSCARRITGRSSTTRCGPTTPSRWRCAWRCSTSPGSPRRTSSVLDVHQRPRAGRGRWATTPIRSPTWSGRTATGRSATRPSAASRCAAAAAPTCRSRGGRPSTSGTAGSPTRSCPRRAIPKSGFLVTANNRIAPDDYPHHITSDYLDGYRARADRAADRRHPGARPRELRGDADGHALDPRVWRRPAGWPGCAPATSASGRRSSGCAPGTAG